MSDWPELPIEGWRDTYATLHLCTQVVGKVRLALTPRMNEWWNVPLYVTTRGLTTSPMPYGDRSLSIDLDFIDHRLLVQDSAGQVRVAPLVPRTVREFCSIVFAALEAIDVHVEIEGTPQECPVTTKLTDDVDHTSYDPDAARRFFHALARVEPVFQRFRAGFRGKCSPVHFFWGSFDLAVTRFNGRRAPARKGLVERIAYDEEVCSVGFWPGDPWTAQSEAAFYAYTSPEPAGAARAALRPAEASYSDKLREYVLPYEAVRRAADPARAILEFAQSAYDAGATLAGWDREALAYP